VWHATRHLKDTLLQAEAEGRAAEAAALRAEKDHRLAIVSHTRHMILAANRGMHDATAAAAQAAREAKRAADAEADARRRSHYDSRVAAHELAHRVAEHRVAHLEEIEDALLQRLRSHTGEILVQQHAEVARARSPVRLATALHGRATAAGLALLAQEPLQPPAHQQQQLLSSSFSSAPAPPPSRGRPGSRAGGSLRDSQHWPQRASSPAYSSASGGGGMLLSTYLGGGGALGGGGHSRSMVLPGSPLATRSVSVPSAATRRRMEQTTGSSYAIF